MEVAAGMHQTLQHGQVTSRKTGPVAPGGNDLETFLFNRMRYISGKFSGEIFRRGCAALQQTTHLQMMGALRLPQLLFEANDLYPVLAQCAIHGGAAFDSLTCALDHDIGNMAVHPKISGLQDFQIWLACGQISGGGIDALDQHTIEEEER